MTRDDLVGILVFLAVVLIVVGLNVLFEGDSSCVSRPSAVGILFLPECARTATQSPAS